MSCCTEQLSKHKRDLTFTNRTGGDATRKCNYPWQKNTTTAVPLATFAYRFRGIPAPLPIPLTTWPQHTVLCLPVPLSATYSSLNDVHPSMGQLPK